MVNDARLVTLIDQEIRGNPVQITTNLNFLRKIRKMHLTRESVSRELLISLDEFLTEGMDGLSPDKSSKTLDRLDLFLWGYQSLNPFGNEPINIEISAPKLNYYQEGKIGWTNEITLEGVGGLYLLQIQNGYWHLH